MDKKIIICFLILLLLLVGISNAGERKTTRGNTLLDVGECNSSMCVLEEQTIKPMLFQVIDFKPYNGKCDFIILFKEIVDPTHGVFWAYYSTQNCILGKNRKSTKGN